MERKQEVNIKVHHVALQTSCFDKAFKFYTEVLKLPIVKEPFNFKGKRTLAWFDAGGIMIELYSVKKDQIPQPYDDCRVGADHIAFEVDNIENTIDYLISCDIKIFRHPFLPPTGDIKQPLVAFIEGPDGEEIELREKL